MLRGHIFLYLCGKEFHVIGLCIPYILCHRNSEKRECQHVGYAPSSPSRFKPSGSSSLSDSSCIRSSSFFLSVFKESSSVSTSLNVYVPSRAFGIALNIFNAPPTMPGHPSLNPSGIVSGGISNKAHNAIIVSFLSWTRGKRLSFEFIALNQRLKKVRAMPGEWASMKCSAAEGL